MLKDIHLGEASSAPAEWTGLGISTPSVFLFVASDGGHGRELWRTDGTAAGTFILKDIWPGTSGSQPGELINAFGTVFFSADDGANGRELWRSDGTAAGTVIVADLVSGSGGSTPHALATYGPFGSQILFAAMTSALGIELWKSDGTSAGTLLVANIATGTLSSSPAGMTVVSTAQGARYLFAAEQNGDRELWITDGTAGATTRLADLSPGGSSGPTEFTRFGNRVMFVADSRLWISDGTLAGTVQLGSSLVGVSGLVVAGTQAWFKASDSSVPTGAELCRSDGTPAGTVLVHDIRGGSSGSMPFELTPAFGGVVFSADDGVIGRELWRSDGTVAGTAPIANIRSGVGGSFPGGFFYFVRGITPSVLFGADDGVVGAELWVTNGATAGTTLYADLSPGRAGSDPTDFVELPDGSALFAAEDDINGRELWRTDGTSGGTVMVADIVPGAGSGNPRGLTLFGGAAYFSAGGANAELWRSDGTTAGTFLVKEINNGTLVQASSPDEFVVFKDRLFFAASMASNFVTLDRELWVSDGTTAGTVLFRDLLDPGSSSPTELTVVGDQLFFVAAAAASGGVSVGAVFVSDGTPTGTSLCRSFGSLLLPLAWPNQLIAFGDRVLFAATDVGTGRELWASDGTPAGTVLVSDIRPSGSSNPTDFVPVAVPLAGNALLFSADDGTRGRELWRTNGTAAGTALVSDIYPGYGSSSPLGLINVHGVALFAAASPGFGYELWRSNGLGAGTSRLTDLGTNETSGLPTSGFLFAPPGAATALFAASEGTAGVELWRTDGTAAGTTRHQNLVTGRAGDPSSNPKRPVLAGNKLLFAALSGINALQGVEPWSMSTMACAVPYGTACPGTGGRRPHIAGRGGAPVLGNAGFSVQVRDALPASISIWLLSVSPLALPIGGGCSLLVNANTLLLSGSATVNVVGIGAAPLPIPGDLALSGLQLFAQHAVVDPQGAFNNQYAFTEGLKIVLSAR